MPDHQSTYDCIIIGGGPAGLTCAITSAADGAIAAIAINKSLFEPARKV